ncbi:MAG: aminotransferase class I/II-fold pyridoxal phosphate-dependent enzyme [Thermodesulfobacteriota bacterium]|nr:aminotransferase class I/II-fold pyridoxal phosphate-dependent enzyme [Thermodesulfobacteriota bacterium]
MDIGRRSRRLAQIAFVSAKRLVRLSLGYPWTTPPLGSVTLDLDDVAVAKKLLRDKKGWFSPEGLEEYQEAFASWNGSKSAFAFMGGRVALSACIHALGLNPNDEVIVPGYTCVVVPNAFHFAGVKTVYADIELDTYGLDAGLIEEKLTSKTRAILLHHLYGLVCRDYEDILNIARKHGLYVIEDCAQATGAIFKNRKVGNLGDVAFYSSEQSKVFTTIQGGLATTNDDTLAKGLKAYWDKAPYPAEALVQKQLQNVVMNYYTYKDPQRWWKGELLRLMHEDRRIVSTTKEEEKGIRPSYYGSKMPAAIAAIGENQLKKIDKYNNIRRETAKKWDKWCDEKGYTPAFVVPHSIPVYLRYPVMVEAEKKRHTAWALKELGVSLGVWFVSNIHPASWPVEGCPNANQPVKHCVNFPTVLENGYA